MMFMSIPTNSHVMQAVLFSCPVRRKGEDRNVAKQMYIMPSGYCPLRGEMQKYVEMSFEKLPISDQTFFWVHSKIFKADEAKAAPMASHSRFDQPFSSSSLNILRCVESTTLKHSKSLTP